MMVMMMVMVMVVIMMVMVMGNTGGDSDGGGGRMCTESGLCFHPTEFQIGAAFHSQVSQLTTLHKRVGEPD